MYFTYFVVMIVESGENECAISQNSDRWCQTIIDTTIKGFTKAVMNDRMMSKWCYRTGEDV